MTKPARAALLPLLLCGVAGLSMWRALTASTLLAATGIALAAGAVAGWVLARPWRGPGLPIRLVLAAIIVVAGIIALTGDRSAPGHVGSYIATFLTVGIPATGLANLGVAPYVVVVAAATAATAASLRGHTALSLLAASLALVTGALTVGRAGVPLAVPGAFMVIGTLQLLTVSRMAESELPPLVGTSTAVRRNQHWWRPAFIAGGAVAVGLAALALPGPSPFDVRQFVEPDVIVAADENPLAIAARLRSDPPPGAETTDAIVTVDGPSPGRLRLAVLGAYRPEGWSQEAVFAVTGNHLVQPKLFAGWGSRSAPVEVAVVDEAGSSGLRASPTAGTPTEVSTATGVRFSAEAGLFLREQPGDLRYRTVPAAAPPQGLGAAPAGTARSLGACVDSETVAEVAEILVTDVEQPLARLDAIGSWLKARHIYDIDAAGGQTLGSVERFIGQDFSLGNLEVFVTSFALLARCADVPVRVVVGYEAPAADATTELVPTAVTAWVETPIAGYGWVAYDPLPTPQEVDAAAALAAADPPPPPDTTVPTTTTTLPAAAADRLDTGDSVWPRILVVAAGAVALAGIIAAAALIARRFTVRRRARVATPSDAVLLAWTTVMERFVDLGDPLAAHLTAGEMARATAGRVPVPVTNMLGGLAVLVDEARFGGGRSNADAAGQAWALADEILARLPRPVRVLAAPLLHLRRERARARLARGMPRQQHRWTGTVPEETSLLDALGLPDVAGYELDARVGRGATGAVFRGRRLADGRQVAIKVFDTAVGSKGFDHQRFVWESRVAESVSGRPHLPEVLGSGFTASGLPYLVTKLYQHGTLVDRVRLGGPLSAGALRVAGRDLASALDTLHASGVIHGDVKPDNVFVDDDDSLVLGDLGASWARGRHGVARGAAATAAYAAPEAWLGHAPTPSSDLYSLGLTLLFAATGRSPRAGAPPEPSEIIDAFGTDRVLALFEVDQRRRLRWAETAIDLFAADDADQASALPAPGWTTRERP